MIEWGPALKILYDNRETVARGARTGWKSLFGSHGQVAFVGPGGNGKTVLFEHCIGNGQIEYEAPGKSYRPEKGKMKASRVKSGLIVAPGQGAARRLTYDKIFDPKKGVDIVVFFSCYGYSEFREELSSSIVSARGADFADFRESAIRRENEELEDVVRKFIDSNLATLPSRPIVLVNALNKVDLYPDEIGDAMSQYSRKNSDNEFGEKIRSTKSRLGTERFHFECIPVCSFLDNFRFGKLTIKSSLNAEMRDAYLWQFKQSVSDILAGVTNG